MSLQIGFNPLDANAAVKLLEAVDRNESSEMTCIDISVWNTNITNMSSQHCAFKMKYGIRLTLHHYLFCI